MKIAIFNIKNVILIFTWNHKKFCLSILFHCNVYSNELHFLQIFIFVKIYIYLKYIFGIFWHLNYNNITNTYKYNNNIYYILIWYKSIMYL